MPVAHCAQYFTSSEAAAAANGVASRTGGYSHALDFVSVYVGYQVWAPCCGIAKSCVWSNYIAVGACVFALCALCVVFVCALWRQNCQDLDVADLQATASVLEGGGSA